MESPKNSYKRIKKDHNRIKNSFSYFKEKYIDKDENKYFLKLNEGKLLESSKALFIPGRIYTYQYDPLYKDVLSYYDKRPVVIVHSIYKHPNTKNNLLVGINLNFLPEKIKVTVLQYYYEQFKKEIERSEKEYWNNRLFLTSSRIISFLKDWLLQLRVFNSKNLNYGFAYRQYIITRMLNPVLVEYDDWEIIPFLHSKEIIGKSLPDIYREYDLYLQRELKKKKLKK